MPAKGVGVKAIVVAGGDAVPGDRTLLVGADLVIAADSGATWLDAVGSHPDLVIGDMDSVDPALLDRLAAAGSGIERHPAEKDASDAELAVERAVGLGADEIVILGALAGARLDHELANLFLIADPRWRGAAMRIVRGGTTVRALHGGDRLMLDGEPGDLVTLLPVGGDASAVTTEGLHYLLDGETVPFGRSRGLSNRVQDAPASVSLGGGTLLVIETRKETDG